MSTGEQSNSIEVVQEEHTGMPGTCTYMILCTSIPGLWLSSLRLYSYVDCELPPLIKHFMQVPLSPNNCIFVCCVPYPRAGLLCQKAARLPAPPLIPHTLTPSPPPPPTETSQWGSVSFTGKYNNLWVVNPCLHSCYTVFIYHHH